MRSIAHFSIRICAEESQIPLSQRRTGSSARAPQRKTLRHGGKNAETFAKIGIHCGNVKRITGLSCKEIRTDRRPLRNAEAFLSYEGGDSVTIDVVCSSICHL